MLFGKFPSALRGLQHVWQLRRLHGRKTGLVDIFTNVEQINLVFTSRDFQPHGKSFDDRFRFVGPQLAFRPQSSDFPFDRLEGKSVIYISLGTLFNEEPDFYVMCFEAFGGVDHQVVMSVGTKTEIGSLGPIPANFIVRNQVPQLQILEQADLFVGHGGHGVPEGPHGPLGPLAKIYQVPAEGRTAQRPVHCVLSLGQTAGAHAQRHGVLGRAVSGGGEVGPAEVPLAGHGHQDRRVRGKLQGARLDLGGVDGRS